MPLKNRSSVGLIVIFLILWVLTLGSTSGVAQVASEKSPILISLDVKEMYLQDVLRLIAEKANVNIILSRGVAQADVIVTLRLKNVDLWQALKAILEISGFSYQEEEGIIRVVKLGELVEEKPSLELEKRRFQLNYIDTTKEEEKALLEDVLKNIMGGEGNFFIDSLTNSIYVEASSSCIKNIKEYFQEADVPPKRIMIKAEFVEVQLSAEEEIGIKWRWIGAYGSYPLGATLGNEYVTSSDSGEAGIGGAFSTPATGLGIIFGSAKQEFRGIIDLLISEGKASLISSPTIVTLEGQEAKIDVGDEHPYRVTKYVEGGWVQTVEFVTIGATLLVTPYIKEEKRVVLDIQPKVSELTGSPPFEGAPPITGTREVKTQIAVNTGETIVIGGLLRETEKETRTGVPLVSDIPFLGSLFNHKTVSKARTDLLIFITPYILSEELEEEDIVEKRKSLKVQIEELYQKGLDYQKNGEGEKARQCFEEVIKRSRIHGFSTYLQSGEEELVKLERLEEERRDKETFFALALGEWLPSRDANSFMIYEAQLRLKKNLRLFGGGGQSSGGSSHIIYLGVRIGDKLNIGVGGINSSTLEKTEWMLTGGVSLRRDKVILEGNYLYVPENQDVNGIRVMLGIEL